MKDKYKVKKKMNKLYNKFLIIKSYLSIYLSIKNSLRYFCSFSKLFIKFSLVFSLCFVFSISDGISDGYDLGCYNPDCSNCAENKCKPFKGDDCKTCDECESICYDRIEDTAVSGLYKCVGATAKLHFAYFDGITNNPENQYITYKGYDIETLSSIPKLLGYEFEGYTPTNKLNLEYRFFNSDGTRNITTMLKYWNLNICPISYYKNEKVIFLWPHFKKRIYNCDPGEYFNRDVAECIQCPIGSYCPGIANYEYDNPKDHKGIFKCPEGTTSDEGATNDGENGQTEKACYSDCTNEEYLPRNSRKCETCPRGYYCTGGELHKKDAHQGIKLCLGGKDGQYLGDNKECHPCSELYTGNQDTEQSNKDVIVSEPKFKLEFFSKEYELTTDGKPSGFSANNSNSNSNKAKKSCYISGGVYKNWGEGNNSELELYGDCFYGIDDNNSGSNPSQNDIEVTDCSRYCSNFNGGSYDKDQCEACVETCKNECRNKYYDLENLGKCEEKCNSQNPNQGPPGLI